MTSGMTTASFLVVKCLRRSFRSAVRNAPETKARHTDTDSATAERGDAEVS